MGASIETLRAQLRRRQQAADARAQARAQRLRAKFEGARGILHAHGATDVVVFGSLATGEVRETSDVDLAVRDLPETEYFAALGELMAHFGTPVDLVRMEEAPASLRERISAEGRPL